MATGRHRIRLTARQRLSVVLAAATLLVGIPAAFFAFSAPSASALAIGDRGVQNLCSRTDYGCARGGYAGAEPWGWYTRYGTRDASGRLHNCTSYAAFRLAQNGVPKTAWFDNASGWATKARAAGERVDGTPTPGAIAQWNGTVRNQAGHVAYVESVTATSIELTDDMASRTTAYNRTNRWIISRGSPSWPNNFIHFRTRGAPTPTPTPTPTPIPTGGPVFAVMNTSETPPDGVWFRDNPNAAGPRLNGYGVYAGDRVQLRCYGTGAPIGAYANRVWYYAGNLTRPNAPGRANVGWLNAHYVNDGRASNQVVPGVRPC